MSTEANPKKRKTPGSLERLANTVNDAMTLEQYKRARAIGDEVHFVLPQPW